MRRIAGVAGLAWTCAIGACGRDVAVETGTVRESGTTSVTGPSEPTIASYVPDCIDAATYHGALTTAGLTSGLAVLDIWDTASADGWNEEHDLLSTSIDQNGASETLEITLNHTDDTGGVVDYGDGTGTTQFSCDVGGQLLDPAALTYAIRIYDLDNALADCEAFGADPAAVPAGTYPTAGGLPSSPDELTGCRVLAGTN